MPYLYHAFVSAKTDSADSGLVRPTNWNDRLEYSNTAATGPSGTDAFVRQVLQADQSFYVATTGANTATNGLTALTPWLTLQYAYDNIIANYDQAGYTATINVADGTYSAGVTATVTPTGPLVILGNTVTRANVLISTAGDCFSFTMKEFGYRVTIKSLKMTSSAGAAITSFGLAHMGWNDVDFGACLNEHVNMRAGSRGICEGSYVITGGGAAHVYSFNQSYIELASVTVTLTGTPAFTIFAYCASQADIAAFSVTFSGAATGSRFSVSVLSQINSFGGGANYFPGNAAGSTDAATYAVYA